MTCLDVVQAGHTEVVSTLLSSGCGLNRGDLNGASPLMTSVRQGHEDTTRLITARDDVDLDWTDNERRTALIVASQLNHRHIVHRLIAAGTTTQQLDPSVLYQNSLLSSLLFDKINAVKRSMCPT